METDGAKWTAETTHDFQSLKLSQNCAQDESDNKPNLA